MYQPTTYQPATKLQPASEADLVLDHLLSDRLLWLDVELEALEQPPEITPAAMGRVLAQTLGDAVALPRPDERLQRLVVHLLNDLRRVDMVWTVESPADLVALEPEVAEIVLHRLRRLVEAVRALAALEPAEFVALIES